MNIPGGSVRVAIYTVEVRSGRVVLPAVGDDDALVTVSSWEDAEDRAIAFARRKHPRRQSHDIARTSAVLVHHGDNTYNSNAVSVSVPAAEGGTRTERHLGYLYDSFLRRVGMTALPRLIQFAGGEVECTVALHPEDFVADGADAVLLDVPAPAVLGEAIRQFLKGHGIDVTGPLAPVQAPREWHTHVTHHQLTTHILEALGVFGPSLPPVNALRVRTVRYGGAYGRSLRIDDGESGRRLGHLDRGLLCLRDDRERDAIRGLLTGEGIDVPVLVDTPTLPGDGTRSANEPINVRIESRGGGWSLTVPSADDPIFATYNPAQDVLWVEDSRLVPAALHVLHRHGVNVSEVGTPRTPWGLDDQVPYSDLWGHSQRHTGQERWDLVPIRKQLRPLVPPGLLNTVVAWVPEGPYQPDPDPAFMLLEKFVRERYSFFPVHSLTGSTAPCRLCAGSAAEFTTPISTSPLAYCHRCLEAASEGLVEDRERSAVAVAELSGLEFDGKPMLAHQLDTLHVNPRAPVDATVIDRLVLLRFGVVRKRVAWTLVLEAAGLAEDGLRRSRGTLIRARDGHLCHSLRERAVCDFLHQHDIRHEREPLYPKDPDYNVSGLRRADWLLHDGTLVELWGMPNDPQYAAKMVEKRRLAARHGLTLVELLDADLPKLPQVFGKWLRPSVGKGWAWSPLLVASETVRSRAVKNPGTVESHSGNDFNAQARAERLKRCAEAVRLQRAGLARAAIGRELGMSAETVKMLLRDGKFYADPTTDPSRASLAQEAASAQSSRLTRAEFQAKAGLSGPKSQEAWRDAAVLHGGPAASNG